MQKSRKGKAKERDFQIFSFGFEKGQAAGRTEEREKWLDQVPRGMMSITIRVRDDDDQVESIRSYFSKSEICYSAADLIPYLTKEVIAKIIHDGKIITKWLPKP